MDIKFKMAEISNHNQADKFLSRIQSPADLRRMAVNELPALASEIRQELISVISRTGGHLAPNMGVVELTIALHRVFNTPEDKLVWDVGHQAYVHKLLTGRRELFQSLRSTGGCLGFLSREESEYDVFGAGHAGTAISAALGLAVARDRRSGKEKVVAVVGDGSLNCGISFEGLNNVAESTRDLIIILNDNRMSISPNVGAMARYLSHIITGRSYNRFKGYVRELVRKIPAFGNDITSGISRIEEATKSMFAPGVIFEELGLRYVGPIDGHNLEELLYTLDGVKNFEQPALVHVITEKGHGYKPAVDEPEKFHGLSTFDPDTGIGIKTSRKETFSDAFGAAVCRLAEEHDDVAAITAAMCYGTGLNEFAERFPERFFDVGIAEEHAAVFAAGLAVGGMRPVVAVYASFLQRALDYVFHDICLQQLPVIFCLDRAGVVDDGPTHHGIHDLGFLQTLDKLSILAPRDGKELELMLQAAYAQQSPVVIRYPRGESPTGLAEPEGITWGKAEILREGRNLAIWGFGAEAATAFEVAGILAGNGIDACVVNVRFLIPFDEKMLCRQASLMPLFTIEDHQLDGGLAAAIDRALIGQPHKRIRHFGWGRNFVPHGKVADLKSAAGLDAVSVAEEISRIYRIEPSAESDQQTEEKHA